MFPKAFQYCYCHPMVTTGVAQDLVHTGSSGSLTFKSRPCSCEHGTDNIEIVSKALEMIERREAERFWSWASNTCKRCESKCGFGSEQ